MDFEYRYTAEQERFRQEVRDWLAEHVPADITAPVDPEVISDELFDFAIELRHKLGDKGWLYPVYPKEYGGGGLSAEYEVILEEELQNRKIPTVFSNVLVIPAILVWGTEEQKQRWLPGLLTGRTIAFQNFTEPQSGSDLATIKSTAVRDGDDWIINGQKVFVSGGGPAKCDILFGPVMTDPDAPRHKNLGYFIIDADMPGVTLTPMELLNGKNQNTVTMDNVRVPGDYLIGGDHQGWQVTQTTLEQEHGGRGMAYVKEEAVDELVEFVGERKRNGGVLADDPFVAQQTVESVIDAHVAQLLNARNFSMYHNKEEMTYHGSQASLFKKEYRLRNSDRIREAMGPFCLLGIDEPLAPFKGEAEVLQRAALWGSHPGGTPEVQRVIIARRLGISKTKEKAAPTPATATSNLPTFESKTASS